jgi:large subunit ribosomal protein L16
MLYEVQGVPEALARSAFQRARFKLPVKTRFVKREALRETL